MNLGTAEKIDLEETEHGFVLHITTNRGVYVVNVHTAANELLAAAMSIEGWLQEGRAAAPVFACNPDEILRASRRIWAEEPNDEIRSSSDGYGTDDPKHPDWHSVHADLYDSRDKG